mmetsp:Transcript_77868/g.167018  ORF Transcript_77868/g.167018 Transcript_77868/m.167018 type:complete len:227 (-) Transcript_77868:151-831(-)
MAAWALLFLATPLLAPSLSTRTFLKKLIAPGCISSTSELPLALSLLWEGAASLNEVTFFHQSGFAFSATARAPVETREKSCRTVPMALSCAEAFPSARAAKSNGPCTVAGACTSCGPCPNFGAGPAAETASVLLTLETEAAAFCRTATGTSSGLALKEEDEAFCRTATRDGARTEALEESGDDTVADTVEEAIADSSTSVSSKKSGWTPKRELRRVACLTSTEVPI